MEENIHNQQNDSIPEGLEFNESYMTQAFEMYDAAKKSRKKRRLFIWFWRSSLGFAAVAGISIAVYYGTQDRKVPAESKQQVVRQTEETGASEKTDRVAEQERSAVSRADNRTGDHSQKVATTQATTSGVSSSSITSTADATIKSNRKTIKSRKSTGRKQGGKTPVVSETGSAGRFLVSLLSSTDSPIFEIADATDRSNSINASASAGDSTNLSQQTDNTLQPKDSTEVADSTLANTIPSGTDTAKVLPFINTSNHHIYMNLGVNTLFGIAELQNQFTMRESIGLGYDYTINTRYFFSLNAEYHSISKISYYRYIGENTKNISSSTYFTKTTLKYISIDPKIGVYLGKRHHVTLGAGLEFLLKDSDPGFEVKGYADEGSQTSGDYYSRFSPVNFYAGVGYGFRFSKNASLFATYHYGFSDLIRNSEANTTFDRNSRLQLLLRVKLF
ncbi:MAG: hypothetical protein A3D31_01975 [Candidatus Fluviicola riflensis]|nr:MAG: hypothetical protein CHH17_13060 [Candidatus Fluviicola riflensis]OGS78765.1 MAG: hypothetical protein A3D31_01975 [Candidatus Fluviicola riflensis]OGS86196.1 MAG: hypothetical protein A2724_01430 [Fluviicola sp. RIFCSPHIGHO2_01_FULL_43_53]OGS87727.1 MAG: hypothetical protein A3E30_16640 [Fluviicola sp. RIFCSPHIGHO2_12_FULL_43_24]